MAWIAKLDARAQTWPTTGRVTYLVLKWSLVVLGAAGLLNAWFLNSREIASWF